ncbi:MAG: hypothetical protein RIF33_13270 [Cyclobacteriaceae bacterium]
MIRTILALSIMAAILVSCQDSKTELSPSGWRMVYKIDREGNPVAGSMDDLISGIRNGYSVRVGWGWERERGDSTLRLEHMAEPIFLSLIQEKDVSVVIDAHPLLDNYIDIDQQQFREGGHIWQTVLTTGGTFNAKVYHRGTGELIRDMPQRQRMTWFVEYPQANNAIIDTPLYE